MSARRTNLREDLGDIYDQLERWSSFILANLLWCIVSIAIITIPAATAGLFSVMSLRARGKQPDLFPEFFGAMRRLWLKSSLIGVLDLLAGGLIVLNLSIFPMMDMSDPLAFLARSITYFVAFVFLLVNLYLWSLLVVLDVPLKQLIETSLKLVFIYPVWSVGVLAAAVVPILISLFLPQAILLLVTVAGCVFIICKGTWRIIRRHLSESELAALEAAHSP